MKYASVFLLLISHLSFSQSSRMDSLTGVFNKATGEDQLNVFYHLIREHTVANAYQADSLISNFFKSSSASKNSVAWGKLYYRRAEVKYFTRQYEQSWAFLDTAQQILEAGGVKTYEHLGHVNKIRGLIFQRRRQYDTTEYYLSEALRFFEKGELVKQAANTIDNIGTNYWYLQEYPTAMEYYQKALKMRQSLKDTSDVHFSYSSIALVYKTIGQYDKSVEYNLKSIRIKEFIGEKSQLPRTLNNLGNAYMKLEEYDLATQAHLRSMELRKQASDSIGWAMSLINVGGTLQSKGDYGSSLDYLQQAYEIEKKLKGDGSMAVVLLNMGIGYENLEQYAKGRNFYLQALELSRKHNDYTNTARVLNNLNSLNMKQGRFSEALKYGLESLEIAQQLNLKDRLFWAHKNLTRTYRLLGQPEKALTHYDEYIALEYDLKAEEKVAEVRRLEMQYAIDIKERELKNKESQLASLEVEQDLLESRQWLMIVTIIALLALLAVSIMVFRMRIRKNQLEKKLLEERNINEGLQKKQLEEELAVRESNLIDQTERMRESDELIVELTDQIERLKNEEEMTSEGLNSLAGHVEGRSGSNISWNEFRLKFDEVHKDFVSTVVKRHPEVTGNEMDLCILLKINLTYKDMAQIQNISYDGVKKAMQRLYKKLNFSSSEELRVYLLGI